MSSQKKILLVDDEAEFVTTLAERLEIRGFKAEAATSGKQALEFIKDRNFDAAILDVKMPGMDGLQVMKKIRELHPDVPIILLTGYGSTDDGVQGVNKGAFDYLMKPLDIEELISKIQEALASKT